MAAIIASVEPQVTQIRVSGSTSQAGVGAADFRGDRLPEVLRSPGDRVLVHVSVDRRLRSRLQLRRAAEIGEALRQIDRAVAFASRVISRITDSVKVSALALTRRAPFEGCGWVTPPSCSVGSLDGIWRDL